MKEPVVSRKHSASSLHEWKKTQGRPWWTMSFSKILEKSHERKMEIEEGKRDPNNQSLVLK
jgi:hypothetical protein